MIFSNKIEKTYYYIKEFNSQIEFKIKTNKIEKTENKITISYRIIENSIDNIYILEEMDG